MNFRTYALSRHLGGQGLTDRTDTHLPLAQRVERIGVLSPELRNLDNHDPEYDTQIVPVLMNAALLESSNSNFRDALSYAERIIASHWPMPDAYVLKARALRHLENTPESNARALEALGMAEQIDVELNAGVYYEKALIHFRMNRTDEAEAALLTLRDSFEWESDSGVRIRRWINDMLVRVNAMRSRE